MVLTLLHSERPKLYGVLAILSVIGLKNGTDGCNIVIGKIAQFVNSLMQHHMTLRAKISIDHRPSELMFSAS